jgi:hypothetical protein
MLFSNAPSSIQHGLIPLRFEICKYIFSFIQASLLCCLQVKIPCCPLLEVTASGAVAADNGGVLGRYKQVGEYNGFQHYQVRLQRVHRRTVIVC